MEVVELRNGEGRVLLLLRDTVLGDESIIRHYMRLCLKPRGRVLKVILSQPQVLTFLGESTKSRHKP